MKRFTKLTSVILSLILCASFMITTPVLTVSAAETNEELVDPVDTETEVDTDAKEENKGKFFEVFGSLFDAEFINHMFNINWGALFSEDLDWKALFSGEINFGDSKELETVLSLMGDVFEGIEMDEEQAKYFQELLQNKFFTVNAEKLIDKVEEILHGGYKDYVSLFKGDYTALLEIIDGQDMSDILEGLLAGKSDKVKNFLSENGDLIRQLIEGNYSYVKALLEGDYRWIDAILNGVDTNLNILFANLDHATVQKLLGEKGDKILEFVDKYYDQIKAICQGDYTYIQEIKDGEYDAMFELAEDVMALVGFEYEEVFGNAVDKVVAFNDSNIRSILDTLISMLHDVLPEKYQELMGNIVGIVNGLLNIFVERYGDINYDDDVSLTDVVLVQRNIASIKTLSDYQRAAADVDRNGVVTMNDIVVMQRHIANLVEI